MKKVLTALFLIAFQFDALSQAFDIEEIFVRDTINKKTANNFPRVSNNFFEDDKYIVRKTCSGEWGGTIWFKNKKTGIERSCAASCPVVVNKLDGKYFVTATLDHMMGFSQIIEIDDPELLTIFKLPKPRAVVGKRVVRVVGDDESKSLVGSKSILDTMKVSMLLSFPFNGQLYHLFTDYKKTYVGILKNGKLSTINTISQSSFWSYDTEVIRAVDKHFVVLFKNKEAEGYIDVFGNKISITRYR